jgi:transcription elongation GreA/GreB family factor
MVFLVALSLIFILMVIAARLQALKAQDRLIRLEERLRYTRLLPPELAAQAMTMRTGTTIALRFASDDELEKLVTQVLNGELTTSKEIKRAITNWNGDYLRV